MSSRVGQSVSNDRYEAHRAGMKEREGRGHLALESPMAFTDPSSRKTCSRVLAASCSDDGASSSDYEGLLFLVPGHFSALSLLGVWPALRGRAEGTTIPMFENDHLKEARVFTQPCLSLGLCFSCSLYLDSSPCRWVLFPGLILDIKSGIFLLFFSLSLSSLH